MKSLDQMTRASGKNYYKNYRAAAAYQQRKPKQSRNNSPKRIEIEPYHYNKTNPQRPVEQMDI